MRPTGGGWTRTFKLHHGSHYSVKCGVRGLLLASVLLGLACASASESPPPILRAVQENDFGRTQELLAGGADVNTQNLDGSSPLHYAAYEGSPALVRLLIEQGADVNANGNGVTPLHYAALKGRVEVVRVLLDHAVGVDPRSLHGNTPLSQPVE